MFVTNEPELQPGVLAEKYRRRCEVEKVFDEFKQKLGEKKAWESSQEGRVIEGRFLETPAGTACSARRRAR